MRTRKFAMRVWSRQFVALTNRILLCLKVTSVWTIIYEYTIDITNVTTAETFTTVACVYVDLPTQHTCTPLLLTSGFRGNKSKDGGIKKQCAQQAKLLSNVVLCLMSLVKASWVFPYWKKNIYISTSLISHLNMLSCICSCYIHLMFRSIFQHWRLWV